MTSRDHMALRGLGGGGEGGVEEGEEKKETDHGSLDWRHHPSLHKAPQPSQAAVCIEVTKAAFVVGAWFGARTSSPVAGLKMRSSRMTS